MRGTLLTGTLFAPVIRPMIEGLNSSMGTELTVVAVENNYFGGDVSVAGLLTGGDLVSARDRLNGDFVIIPRTTLKSDEEIMLDGMTLQELAGKLDLPVHAFDFQSFAQFLSAN
jgi:NifB/MoaA-like Fe-S oxidoreductase